MQFDKRAPTKDENKKYDNFTLKKINWSLTLAAWLESYADVSFA
jgi:hypothetical protein